MRVAIKVEDIYFRDKGVVELRIVDPDLSGDDIFLKLKVGEMSTIDIEKEWKEIGESSLDTERAYDKQHNTIKKLKFESVDQRNKVFGYMIHNKIPFSGTSKDDVSIYKVDYDNIMEFLENEM